MREFFPAVVGISHFLKTERSACLVVSYYSAVAVVGDYKGVVTLH